MSRRIFCCVVAAVAVVAGCAQQSEPVSAKPAERTFDDKIWRRTSPTVLRSPDGDATIRAGDVAITIEKGEPDRQFFIERRRIGSTDIDFEYRVGQSPAEPAKPE